MTLIRSPYNYLCVRVVLASNSTLMQLYLSSWRDRQPENNTIRYEQAGSGRVGSNRVGSGRVGSGSGRVDQIDPSGEL